MPDFSKGSTFNQDANFQGVKFGADAPLLETELNELQDIQTEARADIVRDSIPSGFVQLGELDFDYMLNYENCVKLKTDSVAYVNGYKIKIPKDTIINIGRAPEKDAREDLLFLEVWKEEVTKDSSLTIAGGEGQASTTNNILDPRVGQETSRRIALKWRIRHVENIDFNLFEDGIVANKWGTPNYNFNVTSQGANQAPLYTNSWDAGSTPLCDFGYYNKTMRNSTSLLGKRVLLDDVGLYLAGDGTTKSKNVLKTVDGYSYAIPMFRLYRKPSRGKALPFEYQKINPKVDYTKFANLMKEDRVERVTSETVGGRSLVNMIKSKTIQANMVDYVTYWGYKFPYGRTLVSGKTYTLIVDFDFENVSIKGLDSVVLGKAESISTSLINYRKYDISKGLSKVLIDDIPADFKLINGEDIILIVEKTTSPTQPIINVKNLMILEGDWTNKEIPKYFTGLKSLGEDENNLIEVKTGILNESYYDPDTGTPKLTTVSGINYITSDNKLVPNIVAQVKRGDSKLSDLTSFNRIDSLMGDEKVEFTKIKGRTLQNLASYTDKSSSVTYDGETYRLPYSLANLDGVAFNKNILKANTTYTYSINITNNDINGSEYNALKIQFGSDSISAGVPKNVTGTITGKITTGNTIDSTFGVLLRSTGATYGSVSFKNFIVLEGDYTIPNNSINLIPYVDDIKSVGENEDNKVILTRLGGKNLFTKQSIENAYINNRGIKNPNTSWRITRLKINPNKKYFLSGLKTFPNTDLNNFLMYDSDGKLLGYKSTNKDTYLEPLTNTHYVEFSWKIDDIESIQFEEGESATPYELPNVFIQEITLKEPLRGLPNNVCDTIEGNKVIRRVGSMLIDGSQTFLASNTNINQETHVRGYLVNDGTIKENSYGISSSLPYVANYNSLATTGFSYNITSGNLHVVLPKSALNNGDMQSWFRANPTTFYYELANPVEELIEPNYDKESIKTYQLDAPLRSLPNGVKDEIVGDKLIRRCGEVILNGTEVWKDLEKNDNYVKMSLGGYPVDMKYGVHGCCDKFNFTSDQSNSTMSREYIGSTSDKYFAILLSVSASKLSSQDTTGFKNWLKANPVKVVYELATPIEIPLKEIHSSKSDFTNNRQFKEGNWLRELPNGAKDTVENGKVIRRVGKCVINSSSAITKRNDGDTSTTISFQCTDVSTSLKLGSPVESCFLTDTFKANQTSTDGIEGVGIGSNGEIFVEILRSRLNSLDVQGFKTWLVNNPITILYELLTPQEEVLSTDNYIYYPYHEVNTYCGSLYVGDGTVDTFVGNGLKTDKVIIDTPFRSIENKAIVSDCRYKNNIDGYDTMYSNIYDGSFSLGNFDSNTGAEISHATNNRSGYVKVSENTNYTILYKLSKVGVRLVCYNRDKQIISVINNVIGDFTTPQGCYYIRFTSDGTSKDWAQIMVIKGSMILPFIPYNTTVFFENTEANDIDDLRHQVSLTGFNYEQVLNENFDKLLRGEL